MYMYMYLYMHRYVYAPRGAGGARTVRACEGHAADAAAVGPGGSGGGGDTMLSTMNYSLIQRTRK